MQVHSRPNTNSRLGLMYTKKKFTNTRVVSCQMDGAAEGTKLKGMLCRGEAVRVYVHIIGGESPGVTMTKYVTAI